MKLANLNLKQVILDLQDSHPTMKISKQVPKETLWNIMATRATTNILPMYIIILLFQRQLQIIMIILSIQIIVRMKFQTIQQQ